MRAIVSVVLVPASVRREHDAPAVLQARRAFRQFVGAILIALHVDVRADAFEQLFGRRLAESDHGVDAAQRPQHFGAFARTGRSDVRHP